MVSVAANSHSMLLRWKPQWTERSVKKLCWTPRVFNIRMLPTGWQACCLPYRLSGSPILWADIIRCSRIINWSILKSGAGWIGFHLYLFCSQSICIVHLLPTDGVAHGLLCWRCLFTIWPTHWAADTWELSGLVQRNNLIPPRLWRLPRQEHSCLFSQKVCCLEINMLVAGRYHAAIIGAVCVYI